jgi:parallel beta-helix repeat protein
MSATIPIINDVDHKGHNIRNANIVDPILNGVVSGTSLIRTDTALGVPSDEKIMSEKAIRKLLVSDIVDSGNIVIQRGKNTYVYRELSNTDVARGAALNLAFANSLSGDCIIIGSGNYSISTTLTVKASQTIVLQSANITSVNNLINVFTINFVNNWKITGNGVITGVGSLSGSLSGGLYTNERAISITGTCSRWDISGLLITNFKGCAIFSNAASGSYPYDKGGIIHNCNIYSNNFGIYFDSPSNGYASHYNIISDNHIYGNALTGIHVMGGNCIISRNIVSSNLTDGIYIGNGYNSAHGIISDNEVNHNVGVGIKFSNTPYGMTVSNNHILVNATNIQLDSCKGINITGGMIYASSSIDILVTGVLLGNNYITGINSSNYDLTLSIPALEKLKVYIKGCFNSTSNIPTYNDSISMIRKTPSSSIATGKAGDTCYDNTYVYVCISDNVWVRSLLTTW